MNSIWTNVRVISDEASNVSKYVFEKDDAVVEAVLYRYPDYKTRTVICCSTQSGCPIGCRFCGSGEYFVRNMSYEEIVAQVDRCIADTGVKANEINRLQVMFMSMGEPMLNMKQLIPACHELYKKYPNAALLISTSAPDVDFITLYEAAAVIPTIGLQFSVHESTDEARNKLIPFKKKLSLLHIADEGHMFLQYTGRKPFFNYCAHDTNSTEEDADRLLALFDPEIWCATVSVICERQEWLPASNEHQRSLATDFASKLVERGYNTRMFDPSSQDTVGGGCGQLWFVQQWMKENPEHARPSCGNGLPQIHTPTIQIKAI